MFTIEFDYDGEVEDPESLFTVCLCFVDQNTTVDMYFDNVFAIADTDLAKEIEGVGGPTNNGEWEFIWHPSHYSFILAKYGCGQGGSFTLKVARTPEAHQSLIQALSEWKERITVK